ncbi:recombinase family protein [Acinetobacter baumannii]
MFTIPTNSPKNDFTLKVPTMEGIHLLYLEINKIFSLSCQPICNSAIVVHSMDRFARSLKDLVTEVDQLVKRGIAIQFVKENITFTAQATPMDNLMLQLMGAFAQFEREIILERQKEGIKLAAAQGKYKGRVHKLNPDQAKALRQAWEEGKYKSKVALANAFGISRQAVYRYLQRD